MKTKIIARIFEDVGGYHICPEDGPLTTSAHPVRRKSDALRKAAQSGYTHAVGSGCYWRGVRAIPSRLTR